MTDPIDDLRRIAAEERDVRPGDREVPVPAPPYASLVLTGILVGLAIYGAAVRTGSWLLGTVAVAVLVVGLAVTAGR